MPKFIEKTSTNTPCEKEVKLLDTTINEKLKCDNHVNLLCDMYNALNNILV